MVSSAVSPSFTLNLAQGSVRFTLPLPAAQALASELADLTARLKAVAARAGSGEPRVKEADFTYRHQNGLSLEVFCNPNIWPSPFAARVLITLKDEHLRLATEADLTQLVADLNQFLDTNG